MVNVSKKINGKAGRQGSVTKYSARSMYIHGQYWGKSQVG